MFFFFDEPFARRVYAFYGSRLSPGKRSMDQRQRPNLGIREAR